MPRKFIHKKTPLQKLADEVRLDNQAEVWGRYFEDARERFNFSGQHLLQEFAKRHFQFGFEATMEVLSAGASIGDLAAALRRTAQGREMCSQEIDDLVRVAAVIKGSKFILQYLPLAVRPIIELFLELRDTAIKEIIGYTSRQNQTEKLLGAPNQSLTSTDELTEKIRHAYPNQEKLAELATELEEQIAVARPALRSLAQKVAALELINGLLDYMARLQVKTADEYEDDELTAEEAAE